MLIVCRCGKRETADPHRIDATGPICWACYVADRAALQSGPAAASKRAAELSRQYGCRVTFSGVPGDGFQLRAGVSPC